MYDLFVFLFGVLVGMLLMFGILCIGEVRIVVRSPKLIVVEYKKKRGGGREKAPKGNKAHFGMQGRWGR